MTSRVTIVLVCLVMSLVVVLRAGDQPAVPPQQPFSRFPALLGSWQGVNQPPLSEQVLAVLGADDYVVRAYYSPERQGVGLFIGYWTKQLQGDTVHSPLNCLPGAGWEPVSTGTLTFADPRDEAAPPVSVNRVVIQKGLDRQLVMYWYQSHGRIVASEYWGKYYLMVDAISMNRTDGSIVRVTVPINETSADAEQAAEKLGLDFIGTLLPELDNFFPVS